MANLNALVARRLDPTVWWLAGVDLKKKPLGSGTGIASCSPPSSRRNTGQIQHYYVTCQAFPSGPREYEHDALTLLIRDRLQHKNNGAPRSNGWDG